MDSRSTHSSARRRSRLAFWAALGLAVPFVYISSFVVEGGPPVARACIPPWQTFSPGVTHLQVFASDITVGRDGFFAFAASGFDVTPAMVLQTVEVEVRNAAGELVPGEVEILLAFERDQPDSSQFWLGWEARDALEAGAGLSLRVSVRGSNPLVSYEGTLAVADKTAALALPQLEFRDWQGVVADTGPTLACIPNAPGWCGPIEFGTNVERLLEAALHANGLSEPPVAALWEYSVSEVPGKGELAEPLTADLWIINSPLDVLPFYPRFRGDLDEYCLEVTVRDVRSDESLSEIYCASPPGSVPELDSDLIKSCLTVPPEYLSRWCAGRGPSFDPSCPDPSAGGSSGAGGSGGVATAGTGSTTAGSGGVAPTAGTTSVAGAPTDDDDTETTTVITDRGCGCRIAPRNEQRGIFAFTGLLAFATALGVRRFMKSRFARPS